MKRGDPTPWGPAQTASPLGPDGIYVVTTAGHGGLFVPPKLVARVPARHRAYAAIWSGSEQWYEEDCAWAAVALAFPDLFTDNEQNAARQTVKNWIDKAVTP